MNAQRKVVYSKRKHALFGERLSVDIANMMFDVCENIVYDYQELRDFEGFKMELIRVLSVEPPVEEKEFLQQEKGEITGKLFDNASKKYKHKSELVALNAYPVIKDVYENQSTSYENIVVPFTDGVKTLQVLTNLKKAYQSNGRDLVKSFEKNITLAIIDEAWKEHLREMDDLRQSVQQAVYEQKDPLLIYKLESFKLFEVMMHKFNTEIISFLFKGNLPVRQGDGQGAIEQVAAPRRTDYSNVTAGRADLPEIVQARRPQQGQPTSPGGRVQQRVDPVRVEHKTGRNQPCPCGSGKKYKHCHGR